MFQYKAAVVQAAPILLDKQKTIDKIGQLVREAASKKAELILFPEVIIPGYPRGLSFGTVVGSRSEEGRDLFVTEKDTVSDTLYCTLIYFSNKGEYLGKHRKIKPTAAERIIWGEGDGKDLTVYDTTHGKIGGLICWENYMPLARMALYQQGLEIYLAPTADCRQSWQATMEHIAVESRCYVLGCNQFVTKNQYPQELQKEIENQSSPLCSGGSVIISPLGKVLAGPLFNEEGILYADIDHREIIKSKMDFDVIGHYNRPDIFEFRVKDDNG